MDQEEAAHLWEGAVSRKKRVLGEARRGEGDQEREEL
jgi:hypothetical protein